VFVRVGSTWQQQAYLKPLVLSEKDQFGSSVAIDGDTIVVGTPFEDSAGSGVNSDPSDDSALFAGAAYVFVRDGSKWTQQAYVKATNTDANDGFGSSVAIAGDRIAIGAPGEASKFFGVNGNQADDNAPGAGAVYLYSRTGTSWSPEAYLKASNAEVADNFGVSVACDGDAVAVGAPEEQSDATGVNGAQDNDDLLAAGAAYVFELEPQGWQQTAYLKASNTGWFDQFGSSIAMHGNTVVVGAPQEDGSATGINGPDGLDDAPNSGAAYVYRKFDGSWVVSDYLKASNTGNADEFGWAVAAGDGTLVVGTPFEDSGAVGIGGDPFDDGAPLAGACYVFSGLDDPITYCTAKASSAGCLAQVCTTGSTVQPISSQGDFFVGAAPVDGRRDGLLFGGPAGAANLPFLGATLCVQPPVKRGPIQSSGGTGSSGCSGSFSTLINDGVFLPQGLDAGPGRSAWYQYWYRDPANGAGQLGAALSNAVQLDFR